MNKLRGDPRGVAKNPVAFLATAIIVLGLIVPWFVVANNNPTQVSSQAGAYPTADDVDLGSAATVQGIHTTQDPGAGVNQQNNLNGNSAGSAPLNVHPSSPPSGKPIIVEPDPLPIIPVSPCKHLLPSSQGLCHPICNPCGSSGAMVACPLNENSQVRYPCGTCNYPIATDPVCRIEGTPVGQL